MRRSSKITHSLETKRLIIRPFSEEDCPALAALLADPEVMRYASKGVLSFEQTFQLIQEYIDVGKTQKFSVCALVLKKSGYVIGFCGLEWHWLEERWQPELVYCLSREYWGKGLAIEAAAAVKKHVVEDVKIEGIISLIRPGNDASIRLAEKLGAKAAGEVIIHGFKKLKYIYPSLP